MPGMSPQALANVLWGTAVLQVTCSLCCWGQLLCRGMHAAPSCDLREVAVHDQRELLF